MCMENEIVFLYDSSISTSLDVTIIDLQTNAMMADVVPYSGASIDVTLASGSYYFICLTDTGSSYEGAVQIP